MRKYILNFATIALLVSMLSFPSDAKAQCYGLGADATFTSSLANITTKLTKFYSTESAYITTASSSLSRIVFRYWKEMQINTVNWWDDWQANRLSPLLKDMAQQISVNYAERGVMLAKVEDAKNIVEDIMLKRVSEFESTVRYEPSPTAGIVDTFGPYLSRTYQMNKYMTQAVLNDQMDLLNNKKGTESATGPLGVADKQWTNYIAYFCDNTVGDLGCSGSTPDYTVARKNRDMGSILWGQKQTYEMTSEKDREMIKSSMSYLLYPKVAKPTPKGTLDSPEGRRGYLERRASMARINAVYYAMAQMVGERVSGSDNEYSADVRSATKIIGSDNISRNPSYREMQEALNRDQFYMPDFFINLGSQSPAQLTRSEVALGAQRSQLMSDMFRRDEELLLVMAADYSNEIDYEAPGNAIGSFNSEAGSSSTNP